MSVSHCSQCHAPRWPEDASFCMKCGSSFSDKPTVIQSTQVSTATSALTEQEGALTINPSRRPLVGRRVGKLKIRGGIITTVVSMLFTFFIFATTDMDERFLTSLSMSWVGGGISDCITPVAYSRRPIDGTTEYVEEVELAIGVNCSTDRIPRSSNFVFNAFDPGDVRIVDSQGLEHKVKFEMDCPDTVGPEIDTRYIPDLPANVYVVEGETIYNGVPYHWGGCILRYTFNQKNQPKSIKFSRYPWVIELQRTKYTHLSNRMNIYGRVFKEKTVFMYCVYNDHDKQRLNCENP